MTNDENYFDGEARVLYEKVLFDRNQQRLFVLHHVYTRRVLVEKWKSLPVKQRPRKGMIIEKPICNCKRCQK